MWLLTVVGMVDTLVVQFDNATEISFSASEEP